MLKVITTVGTSIFKNYDEYAKDNSKERWEDESYFNNSYKFRDKDFDEEIKKNIEEWINLSDKSKISAEIKSLLKLKDEKQDEELCVYLLATDTVASSLAAEIIKEILEKEGLEVSFNPENDVIKDLQINDSKKFEQSGLMNLVDRIENIAGGYYENIIFNITGGYKGVIPYLTIMAQIKQCPIVYIFETTDKLIKIPQIPISINWGLFEKYYETLEKLNNGIFDWNEFEQSHSIGKGEIKNLIWTEDGMAELNSIGKFFFNLFKTVFIVHIYKGSNFFDDKAGNRKELEDVLKELYSRLEKIVQQNSIKNTEELLDYILKLSEKDDLRHGTNPGNDKFIFKSTKKTQIRIVYSPMYENRNLSLKVFDYKRGNFNHKNYIEEFKKKWNAIKDNIENIGFVSIPINK